MENIYLVGFMGSGKSTVGKLLATKLSLTFIDVDKLIEKKENRSIKEIFEKEGESYFRNLEKIEINNLSKSKGYVVSTGGGLGADLDNMKVMRETGNVIWLDVTLNTILERCKNDENRPLLKLPPADLKKLYENRKKIYSLANIRINADRKNPNQIVEEIINKLRGRK